MKNLQSIIEGTWIELVLVELTEAEKALMLSTKKEDVEAKKQLSQELKSKREKPADQEDVETAQAIYLKHKPELKAEDVFKLIAVNMTLFQGVGKGIINCRVNGEHKQIRF